MSPDQVAKVDQARARWRDGIPLTTSELEELTGEGLAALADHAREQAAAAEARAEAWRSCWRRLFPYLVEGDRSWQPAYERQQAAAKFAQPGSYFSAVAEGTRVLVEANAWLLEPWAKEES